MGQVLGDMQGFMIGMGLIGYNSVQSPQREEPMLHLLLGILVLIALVKLLI